MKRITVNVVHQLSYEEAAWDQLSSYVQMASGKWYWQVKREGTSAAPRPRFHQIKMNVLNNQPVVIDNVCTHASTDAI